MYQNIIALQSGIKALCKERHITINKLATLSGVTQSTIDSIIRGRSKNPKLETLRKIAKGFDMEYDEFAAYIRSYEEKTNHAILDANQDNKDSTKNNTPYLREEKAALSDISTIGERLRELRRARKLTQGDIANYLGISRTTYSKYENGEIIMNIDMLLKLSFYFHVSTDYILGKYNVNLNATFVDIFGKEYIDETIDKYIELVKSKGEAAKTDREQLSFLSSNLTLSKWIATPLSFFKITWELLLRSNKKDKHLPYAEDIFNFLHILQYIELEGISSMPSKIQDNPYLKSLTKTIKNGIIEFNIDGDMIISYEKTPLAEKE